MKAHDSVRAHLRFYQGMCALLAILLAGTWMHHEINEWQEGRPFGSNTIVEPRAPHAAKIRSLIAPLRYTGLYDFMNPDVFIGIDSRNQTWSLENIHRFDADGNLVLQKNRYGLCGDLAAYTRQKIEGLFDRARYDIQFLLVSESSYFNTEGGTHIILEIQDRQAEEGRKTYLLDPAFRKYGSPHLFGTYRPIKKFERMDLVENRMSGSYFKVGAGPPIHMNSRIMLSLYALPAAGRFDKDNFTLVLSAMRRYEYQTKRLLIQKVENGVGTTFEKNEELRSLLRPGLYEQLRNRVIELSRRVREQEIPEARQKGASNQLVFVSVTPDNVVPGEDSRNF